jgi:5,10-methylenetetrahydrofolate reductase
VIDLPVKFMFEITPPPRRASQPIIEKLANRVCTAISDLKFVEYINIPEVIEENREGKPLYKNLDVREFGKLLATKIKNKIIINKVVAQCASSADFENWLRETKNHFGFDHYIFVGGSRSDIPYAGPSVIDANNLALEKINPIIGNISIPQRNNEDARIFSKTKNGCSFFTTQVLFESKNVISLLEKYDESCKEQKIPPATYYLSFAPISNIFDLEFCRWLGANIPAEVENKLLKSPSTAEFSIELACTIFTEIFIFSKQNGLTVPLGINIEPLTQQNIEIAAEMMKKMQSKSFDLVN